jgi:hypothetical protein
MNSPVMTFESARNEDTIEEEKLDSDSSQTIELNPVQVENWRFS